MRSMSVRWVFIDLDVALRQTDKKQAAIATICTICVKSATNGLNKFIQKSSCLSVASSRFRVNLENLSALI